MALAAIEQHLHRAAQLRTGGVGELQGPQTAGTGGRGGGDEIEGLSVLTPSTIFRPQPVGHAGRNALGVQRGAGLGLHITQIHQLKRADAAAIQPQTRFIRARQVAHLGVGGTCRVNANAIGDAARQAGLLNRITGAGFIAHIHIHLAVGDRVIQIHHHGLRLGQGIGHHVLERQVPQARQLIHLAGIAAREHMGKGTTLGTVLLTRQIDAAVVARCAVAEGTGRRQITRTETRKRRRGAVGPAAAIGAGHVQISGTGEEILATHHGKRLLVDRQVRHIGTLGAMGPHIAGGIPQFMVHHHPQRAVAVIHHPDPIGNAIEAIAVVTKLSRINHLAEHRTPFRSHQERLGGQGGFGNDLLLGIRLSGSHHTELTQLHLAGGCGDGFVDLIGDQEVAVLAGVVTADASQVAADINNAR